jgi:hypothetical protein
MRSADRREIFVGAVSVRGLGAHLYVRYLTAVFEWIAAS